ncbi:excisionase family DNA binding protein [Kibdelosporangium banguiense]|uniref:Excisionase family DNA binding protein n=1 Tax=Kibdelosporangium banguiense TaxID=1365924 RepID=A0ABS4TAV7_9PSEU|nr:helix-turn-helix domain-containing protein [Kibdelosporangium banguiense]MBP2321550.1 excisionase family DNA binding protein [Kibdelosporangium banguiense]
MRRTTATRPTTGDVTMPEPILFDVPSAARQLSISRTTLYELLKAGEIDSVKIGALRRIPLAALHAYTARKAAEYRAA